MSRMIVHESVHDQLVEGMVAMAKTLSVGPGIERTEFGPNMGAMASLAQRDRAADMCSNAQKQGAVAATGGHKLNRPGFFLEPTIFTGVTEDMTIAQEEVFGPVLSVLKFGSDQQAIEIANWYPVRLGRRGFYPGYRPGDECCKKGSGRADICQ